ncbi:PAS domain S-box protein [Pedobacter sp. AW31-3R]|uniref:PAS domain-containing sensor histidine kinase n=1 Tax=Pedobacter sp. AW31-3R TaxID=3445781 RepID=UPI003F9EBED3
MEHHPEYRKDELTLKKSLDLYEKANEMAGVGVWEVDFVTNKLFWSVVTRQIHEVPDDYEPEFQAAINFYKEGFCREELLRNFNHTVETGEPFMVELQLVTFKGNEMWVRAKGSAEFKEGRCLRLFGTLQDIQIQKLQRIQLINSEIKYRSVIENSLYGVLLTFPGGFVLDANQAALKMFGYTLEEIRKLSRYDIFDINHPNLSRFLKRREKDGKAKDEITAIRKNGEIFPCEISGAFFTDIDGTRLNSLVIVDITHIKQAERALALSEDKYRKIFENIQDVYYRTDKDGVIIELSPSIEFYNYKREDLIGSLASDFYYLNEEKDKILNVLKKEMRVSDFEVKLRSSTNELFYASVNSRLVMENGIFMGTEGIIRDITLRKIQENELASLNTELKGLNEHKEKLLSVIAHDLKTPIASSLKLAELALMDVSETSKIELIEYLSKIRVGLDNTNELLEDLLSWAASQFGSVIFNPVCIEDLKGHIYTGITRLVPIAEAKGIKLTQHIDPGIVLIADKDMLDAIIRNIVSNAIKFTGRGGRVEITAKSRKDDVIFSVTDTGIGISPAIVNVLFEKSFNYTIYGTSGEKGTGLGLDLCREFVEKHKGKIWVDSTVGKGSTFYFTIKKV